MFTPQANGSTVPAIASSSSGALGALGLYVTGPKGGGRHLLDRNTLVRIGRGADSTIVVDDPRVSRLHAALHLDGSVQLVDLGSCNGTFVGRERLAPNASRSLPFGETFFIGDSALILQPSELVAPPNHRLLPLEGMADRLSGHQVLIKVRAARPAEVPWVEAIVGRLFARAVDWLTRLGGSEVVVGLAARTAADARALEQSVFHELSSWNIVAKVESTFLPMTDAAQSLGLEFIRGSQVMSSRRGHVVVRDPIMKGLMQTVARVAAVPINVLLLGETGVGKDVVASLLHDMSPRRDKPFVVLNCACLPEALLETELFGHERGAFTGAVKTKVGLLETADGGTVFLDEIGELALPLQAKLLRAIESREITPVGGVGLRRIDVRFVAATNRRLDAAVAAGTFREDLYHRLNGVALTVPPLRERRTEIDLLARHFLDEACARFQLPRSELSHACRAALEAYAWPGNVRELRNVVERAVLLEGGGTLEPHHLGLPAGGARAEGNAPLDATPAPVTPGPEEHSIEEALALCGGNQTRAAQLLRMPRRTLVRRIGRMGLARPRKPVA